MLLALALQGTLPRVAGVALGDSAAAVTRRLGSPDRRDRSMGLVFWEYASRGLSVWWDGDRAVMRAIVLHKPQAGDVEGVRVGDAAAAVRIKWGEPTRVRQDGRFLDYARAAWVQTVEVDRSHVVEITVLAR